MKLALAFVTLFAVVGCRDAKGTGQSKQGPGSAAVGSGSAGSAGSADLTQGEGSGSSTYVPAEFKSGMASWRDVGVYVDGKPIGFLNWGELPISLQPVFVEDEVSINKPGDCPSCPDRKKSSMRWYRFVDYLKAVGIDVKKVKVLHVLAPKPSQTIEARQKDLSGPLAKDFMFRFGGLVAGKALPHLPLGFGNGETPDKMVGVMIYIDRKPPIVTRQGIELDGIVQTIVPYYGEPLRGGIHVYLDDKLAAVIKRAELDVKMATQMPDGELQWNFDAFLKKHGVDTTHIVEGWVIRDDKRAEKIPYTEMGKMSFTASAQAKGHVTLGDKKIIANGIALHTRAIKDSELPVVREDEVW